MAPAEPRNGGVYGSRLLSWRLCMIALRSPLLLGVCAVRDTRRCWPSASAEACARHLRGAGQSSQPKHFPKNEYLCGAIDYAGLRLISCGNEFEETRELP
jgi:hypothetical protein